jgi:hypothetical protein
MTAIYQNQHYKVLSIEGLNVTLLSIKDEVITVLKELVTIFVAVKKRSVLKRKRISIKSIKAKEEAKLVPVEVRGFDSYLAEQKQLFLNLKSN